MTLVLDTSILIDLENKQLKTLSFLKKISEINPDPPKITVVNQFEFLFGLKDKKIANKEKALTLLNNFSVIHTTQKTAHLLLSLKQKYESKGSPMPLADLLIAALTLENHFTLVTKDPDFEKIEELNKIIVPS